MLRHKIKTDKVRARWTETVVESLIESCDANFHKISIGRWSVNTPSMMKEDAW